MAPPDPAAPVMASSGMPMQAEPFAVPPAITPEVPAVAPTAVGPAAPGLQVVPTQQQVMARAAAVEAAVDAIRGADHGVHPAPAVDADPMTGFLLRTTATPAFRELVLEVGRRPRVLDGAAWREVGVRAVRDDDMTQLLDGLGSRAGLVSDGPGHRSGLLDDRVSIEVLEPPRTAATTFFASRLAGPVSQARAVLEMALPPIGAALASGRGVLVVSTDARDAALAIDSLLVQGTGAARVVTVDRRPLLPPGTRPSLSSDAAPGQELSVAASLGADIVVLVDTSPAVLAGAAAAHVPGGMCILASVRASDPPAVQRAAQADLAAVLPVTVTLQRNPDGTLAVSLGGL